MSKLKLFIYLPRILAIIYILFLGIFALDVFTTGQPFSYYLIALAIHLIPNFILLGFLIIALKKPSMGGSFFILASILFTIFFKTYTGVLVFISISFPVFLIGVLFLYQGLNQKRR